MQEFYVNCPELKKLVDELDPETRVKDLTVAQINLALLPPISEAQKALLDSSTGAIEALKLEQPDVITRVSGFEYFPIKKIYKKRCGCE